MPAHDRQPGTAAHRDLGPPGRTRLRRLALGFALLLLILGSLPVRAAQTPRWDGPFDVNGLELRMTGAELDQRLGPAAREFDGDLRVYGGNLLVRVREGLVVNLSAADQEGGRWTLGQQGKELARTGLAEKDLRARFGAPAESYAKKTVLRVLVYRGTTADVGVMTLNGRVVGFMLAEPDMLAPSLMDSGYEPLE